MIENLPTNTAGSETENWFQEHPDSTRWSILMRSARKIKAKAALKRVSPKVRESASNEYPNKKSMANNKWIADLAKS